MSEAIPAATLILWREGTPPEVLMVERAAAMAFAGGAMVFPGGRVDPGDRAMAAGAADPDDAAARIAAIRETIEEAGIAVGLDPAPDAAAIARLRAGLAAGRSFAELLAADGFALVPDRLVPFARWRPNFRETRMFDTRFFLAACPPDVDAVADGGETVRTLWTSPSALLAAADAGARHIIFPTRRNLERLAALPDLAAALAHLTAYPVRTITPWIERRGGADWLCIPADAGYPRDGEPLAGAMRG